MAGPLWTSIDTHLRAHVAQGVLGMNAPVPTLVQNAFQQARSWQ
jgi:hypothetical protein